MTTVKFVSQLGKAAERRIQLEIAAAKARREVLTDIIFSQGTSRANTGYMLIFKKIEESED